ncbi:hypothetical protein [Kineococcus rhizosphaerae]|uniref:Uncharacterized protein n=1 Tax=Kineococcus rhizosphaerae TaxID=559628 RepID=A0A2T0QY51_9ACTN|nr:hypothetical protein [Kineococcus rhizosphaerae]PRY11133.1 hypothetical protein CLV37_11487 [Kineococcus rhizosphaerae]
MSASATATTTFALAVLLGLASFGQLGVLAVAVVLVGALVAAGWPELLDLPARRGTTVLVALVAVAAAATATGAVVRAHDRGTQMSGVLGWLPSVATLSLLAAFAHQLLRRDGRPRLVESVTAAVTAQAVVVLGAAWIAVPSTYAGATLTPVVLTAVVATSAVSATTWPLRVAGPVNLVVGGAAGWFAATVALLLGAGTGDVVSQGRWAVSGIVAGVGAGLLVSAWRGLTSRLPAARTVPAALAVAAVPVALAGGGAYLVGRLVLL